MLIVSVGCGMAPIPLLGAPALEEVRAHRKYWEARDRAELVRPPNAGFKPKAKGKKAVLKLKLRDAVLKPGDDLWYRLELTNVGDAPLEVTGEPGGFFKAGYLGGRETVRFFVTGPDNKREQVHEPVTMRGGSAFDLSFPKGMSDAEAAAYVQRLRDPRRHQVSLTLKPGETLVSRAGPPPDNDRLQQIIEKGEDPDTPPPGEFRPLQTGYRFKKPGSYRIQVVIEDHMLQGSTASPRVRAILEKTLLGTIKSNVVGVQVHP